MRINTLFSPGLETFVPHPLLSVLCAARPRAGVRTVEPQHQTSAITSPPRNTVKMALGTAAEIGKSDPIVTRLAAQDTKKFYQKPNLLYLYLMLFPTCMGIELTSGFDSQMINALQIVPYWKVCKCHERMKGSRSNQR